MSSSQSEEQTMFFTREKNDTSSRIANGIFSHVRKWYVQAKTTEIWEFRVKKDMKDCFQMLLAGLHIPNSIILKTITYAKFGGGGGGGQTESIVRDSKIGNRSSVRYHR